MRRLCARIVVVFGRLIVRRLCSFQPSAVPETPNGKLVFDRLIVRRLCSFQPSAVPKTPTVGAPPRVVMVEVTGDDDPWHEGAPPPREGSAVRRAVAPTSR